MRNAIFTATELVVIPIANVVAIVVVIVIIVDTCLLTVVVITFSSSNHSLTVKATTITIAGGMVSVIKVLVAVIASRLT